MEFVEIVAETLVARLSGAGWVVGEEIESGRDEEEGIAMESVETFAERLFTFRVRLSGPVEVSGRINIEEVEGVDI